MEDLFLIYKNKDGTVRTDSQSYLVSSQDSFIGFTAIDSDFIIAYREKK